MVRDRHALVEHLRADGIDDERVLQAIEDVPRELFVPPHLRHLAHVDDALPIGFGQTISQPYVVAVMTSAAEIAPTDRVLEIGTGSGYQAAVLERLAADVVSVERVPELAERARRALDRVGADRVHVAVGDGTLGWPDGAPFDVVVVTAAGPEVPDPLLDQLADGGRLVAPVGPRDAQTLLRLRRRGGAVDRDELGDVRFVPLLPGVARSAEARAPDATTRDRSR